MTSLIHLMGVAKTYPAGPGGPEPTTVLREVTFDVAPRQLVAITGPSGSGKSTLLNILGLLDRPSSGEYVLADVPVTSFTEQRLRVARSRWIGFVFQAFHLVDYLSVLDNVALPLAYGGISARTRREAATAMLDKVGLLHRMSVRPQTLSGGERQRVAIARALVHRPRLVLCDEPTGNLDRMATQRVMDLLRGLCQHDQCVVVVTHDPSVSSQADSVYELVDGQLHGH